MTIAGYQEISIAFPWQAPNRGLALSGSSACYIDNSPASGNWWFCIGDFQSHGGAGYWPGPESTHTIVNRVELYVNVDHLTQ